MSLLEILGHLWSIQLDQKTLSWMPEREEKKRLQGQRQKRKWRQILPFGATLEERGMLKLIVFQKGARDLGIVE